MATIRELINNGEAILGETLLVRGKVTFIPYFWDTKGMWLCRSSEGLTYRTDGADIGVYVHPVEMEDWWLWARRDGSVSSKMYSDSPGLGFSIKLDYSKTQFPKEGK